MASTDELLAIPRDHSTPKQTQKIFIFGRDHDEYHERKSLQTLQQSASDETALVGIGVTHSSRKTNEKPKIKPIHGPVQVFHDSNDQNKSDSAAHRDTVWESRGTQTEDCLLEQLIQQRLQDRNKRDHSSLEDEEDGEAYELMVKEPVPEAYWKEVAEQRRLALSDTLEENKSLHQSIESLKEENEKLLELASQAEYLSSLLQSVVSDDEDDNKDVDKGENPEGNEKQKETEEEAASEGVDTEAKAASHPHHTEEDVHRTETERGDGETTEVTDQKLSADLSEVTNKDKE